ncbi:hypothetical protein PHMEG_00016417 [Phytophthora megakarya]|uniref:Helitron helicase-like domain-containing protein n=1 Tax=Phytophthora megakarya TaxID=4795 RepID=A0A225VZD6_9STRA|nr:hypothetical protein PHMEG_00016417 [Phytophthora megakarya]
MRSYWGSNEERAGARSNLFSMQLQFGQPTLFFTISLDGSSTYQIGNFAGVIPNDILSRMETDVQACSEYTRYFDLLMNIIVEVVLNWDTANGRARPEPGLFGVTKAYYAATESQNSTGALHAHMLIWINNMPSTVAEYYKLCGSDKFRQAMVEYVDKIAASNVPLNLSLCPVCGVGTIIAVELQREDFQKPRPGRRRSPTARCQDCKVEFGAGVLIEQHASRVEKNHGLNNDQSDSVLQAIASLKPLPTPPHPNTPEAALISRSILFYQRHRWSHCQSCFKVTKQCFIFPKEPCETTHWGTDNRIHLKRLPGKEYVNTFIPELNIIFKCNHDIKFLGAGDGPEKAYYMMKYTTKPQQDIENPWAIHLHAYDKSCQREEEDPSDPVAIGRR